MSFKEISKNNKKKSKEKIDEETSQIWILKHLIKLIPEIEEQITEFVLHQVIRFI